jgi:hypothetical protein
VGNKTDYRIRWKKIVLPDNLIIECYTYRANMTPENFGLLFKSLVIAISGIIALGLAVLTLSGKVPEISFSIASAIANCHIFARD